MIQFKKAGLSTVQKPIATLTQPTIIPRGKIQLHV